MGQLGGVEGAPPAPPSRPLAQAGLLGPEDPQPLGDAAASAGGPRQRPFRSFHTFPVVVFWTQAPNLSLLETLRMTLKTVVGV